MPKNAIAMVVTGATTAIMNVQLAVGLARTARQAYSSNLTVREWVQTQQNSLLDGGVLAKVAPTFAATAGANFVGRQVLSDLAYDLEFGDIDGCASVRKANEVPGDGEGYINDFRPRYP